MSGKSSGNLTGGHLNVILGPMFSGKTSKLIQIYRRRCVANVPSCIINFHEDKRYDDRKLSTHDRTTVPCTWAEKLATVCLLPANLSKYKVYFINEGQFFEDLYETVSELVQVHGKEVHVCGLDGDFRMKRFGQMLDLISIADRVEKLSAVCTVCTSDASFTKRLSSETHQKVIGSSNYIPVCRRCHALPPEN